MPEYLHRSQLQINQGKQFFAKTLGEAEGKVALSLLGGHAPSIGTAVLAMEAVKNVIFTSFFESINRECSLLCQSTTISRFRHTPPDGMASFKWDELINEPRSNSPLLMKVLTFVAVRNDHRNKKKFDSAHYPGIATAAAVLLKERNCHVSGVQCLEFSHWSPC